MIIEEVNQKLKAEIELFKAEAMKTYVVECWANSYTNSDPFAYAVGKENEIFWMKTQAHQLWQFWQSAKANVIPKDFVLVKIQDIREVISNASDAMCDEKTSTVYNETGEPSTWFDHYTAAESAILNIIDTQEQS